MALSSVKIFAKTLDELRALDKFELDLHYRATRQLENGLFMIPGVLTDEEVAKLTEAGYKIEVVADLTKVARERAKEVSKENRFVDERSLDDFDSRSVLGYMTVAEIDAALNNLRTANPDLVTLITLPENTWEGRVCRAIRVRAGTKTDRIGILFTGSMHAREWGGSDICINFVVSLINAYRTNTAIVYGGKTFTANQVRTILENIDLFLFPNVNPDGKNYSQTYDPGHPQSTWWRKNRNPNTATGSTSKGVDLNRNFDFLWSSGIGTSSSPSSYTYKGSAPFSEPETRNIRHLLDTYPNISYYVDIHSYSELILYPWGDAQAQSSNADQNFTNPAYNPTNPTYREFISTLDLNTEVGLANRMSEALTAVRGKHYTVQQAVGLYPTSATSDDYAFSRHIVNGLKRKVYAYTIEFGQEFVPTFTEMSNIIKDVSSAVTELCWAINSDVYIKDNTADTGVVPSTGAFWNSPDVWIRNANDGGLTHQNTIRGQDNFVYVRVRNRGLAEAKNVKVRAYIANFAGTQFSHPKDWVPRNPAGGGTITGPGTYLIGETTIPVLAAGASQVVNMRWLASLISPALNWHPCILVEAAPNDGPFISGSNVWHNNNLAQKNITIVNAHRGEMVELPFVMGSKYSLEPSTNLAVKKVKAPAAIGVYIDSKEITDSVRPNLPVVTSSNVVVASQPTGFALTLVEPTTIAVNLPGSLREGESDEALIIQLPSKTKIEFGSREAVSYDRATPAGFEVVNLANRPMLALSAVKEAKLPISLKPGAIKEMVLRVAVPANAVVGDTYEFQLVEYNDKRRAVGGVVLEVHVVA